MKSFIRKIAASTLAMVVLVTALSNSIVFAQGQDMIAPEYHKGVVIDGEVLGITPRNQMLVGHLNISSQDGFWERSFGTVGSNQGNRLNTFYRNNTGTPAIVRVERSIGGIWHLVHSFTVPAHSERTHQHPGIVLNAQHRVTVQTANGAAVNGNIGIRQTAMPL